MSKNDWHPADIIASLRKRGTTLSAVSREAGLASSTLANALTRHWPKGERLIADALKKTAGRDLAFTLSGYRAWAGWRKGGGLKTHPAKIYKIFFILLVDLDAPYWVSME
ncbi:hypothetical protein OS21_33830 [Dickeya oryzae]